MILPWSTLLWHRCYYPHRSREALSPVCGIFLGRGAKKILEFVSLLIPPSDPPLYYCERFRLFFLHRFCIIWDVRYAVKQVW